MERVPEHRRTRGMIENGMERGVVGGFERLDALLGH